MLISSYVSIISPLGIGPSLPSVAHVSVDKQSGQESPEYLHAGSFPRPQPSQASAGGGPIPSLTHVPIGRAQIFDGCSQQHQSLATWPFQRAAYSMTADFPQRVESQRESQDEATIFLLFFELLKIVTMYNCKCMIQWH